MTCSKKLVLIIASAQLLSTSFPAMEAVARAGRKRWQQLNLLREPILEHGGLEFHDEPFSRGDVCQTVDEEEVDIAQSDGYSLERQSTGAMGQSLAGTVELDVASDMGQLQTQWNDLSEAVRKFLQPGDHEVINVEMIFHMFDDPNDVVDCLKAASLNVGIFEEDNLIRIWLATEPFARRAAKRRGHLSPMEKRRRLDLLQTEKQSNKFEANAEGRGPEASGSKGHWPMSKSGKSLGKSGLGRADMEKLELEKWRTAAIDILETSCAPIALQALGSRDRDGFLKAALGTVRAGTLRRRVREWRRFMMWLKCSYGWSWPTCAEDCMEYVRMRATEPCGHTVPMSFWITLNFFEKVALLPAAGRFAELAVVKGACKQAEQQLQTGAPMIKKAPMYPISLILSLEMHVVNNTNTEFSRAYAWVKLLKLWTSSRTSDVQGLDPSSLVMHAQYITGVFAVTKTTGPGKRIRHIPMYVSKAATLSGHDWLSAGWTIWQGPGFSFRRDYMLPMPNKDMRSCIKRPADYAAFSACTRALLSELKTPVLFHGCWETRSDLMLKTSVAQGFWTEHSERNWLTSVAAAMGVSHEHRNYLGRWGIASTVDEYVRTAPQIVLRTQGEAVKFLKAGECEDICNAGVRELGKFLRDRNVDESAIENQLHALLFESHDILGQHQPEQQAPEISKMAGDADAVQHPEHEYEEDALDDGGQYIVTITAMRRIRRLHKRGVCGLRPGYNVALFETFQELEDAKYDVRCKRCFREQASRLGERNADVEEDSDSSSTSSSE